MGGPAAWLLVLALGHGPACAADAPRLATVLEQFAGRVAGEARLTWWWGFHVYDARLYIPAKFDTRQPTAQPFAFALELTYARSLEGKSIAETSRDEIARLGFGSQAQRKDWFEQMAALLPDVQRGTSIAGVNAPGQGVRFVDLASVRAAAAQVTAAWGGFDLALVVACTHAEMRA